MSQAVLTDLECNCSPGLPHTGDYGAYTTAMCPVHGYECPECLRALRRGEACRHESAIFYAVPKGTRGVE
jgi:hypothetical protein